MSWWVIATIGLAILRQFIKPKVKRPRGQDLEGWFAEEGRRIPQIWGTQSVSPNVVWWGDAFQHDGQDEPVTFYHAKVIGTLCIGPVEELVDIQSGGKSLSLEPITRAQSGHGTATQVVSPSLPLLRGGSSTPRTLAIHARLLFGGLFREGGIEGEARFYWGTPDQPIDLLSTLSVANEAIDEGTARPGVCYIAFGGGLGAEAGGARAGDFYWGLQPNPREIVVVVRTEPTALLELGLNPEYTDARIGFDCNPGEILYDLAVHEIRGAGADPALIDVQSLADLAAVCEAERFGLSATLASPDEAGDLMEEVLRHIDGGKTEDPETGLLSFYLVRPDPEIVCDITDSNTDDLVVEEPNYRELVNDVQLTYRRWAGGVFGTVTEEVLFASLKFLPPFNVAYGQCKGRNISNVHVFADGVELTVLDDYNFDPVLGVFVIFNTGATTNGQLITVSYSSLPTAMKLVEGTAKDYDLADQQITEEVRPMTVDFPYITQELLAQIVAKRTLRAFGLPLKTLTWTINRTGHAIRPGKAVQVTSARWGLTNFVARILPPTDYGTLENGRIRVKAIEDVWGSHFLPITPSAGVPSGSPPPVAPSVVIACGQGGTVVRIALFATDPAFDIELWRADDELGTGAVLVATLPGSTPYWDDAGGEGKSHQARLIRPGFTPGAFTPWITCDVAAPPADPEAILPTVDEQPSQTEDVGTLVLEIIDPQHRVTLVEFKSKSGTEAETAFAVDSAEPWTADVDLLASVPSTISYRVTYVDEAGDLDTIEGTVVFEQLPLPPPTIADAGSGLILIPFHATLTHGAVFRHPPAELAELEQYGRRRVDTTGCSRCRVQIHTRLPLPSGGKVGVQYVPATNTDPAEEDWLDLAEFGGPLVAADVASACPTVSPWMTLDLEARQDIILRPVSIGGDDSTQFDTRQMFVELIGKPVDTSDGDDVPSDPCQDSTDNFGGYEDTVELDETWLHHNPSDLEVAWSLDETGGPDGSRALSGIATGTFASSLLASIKYRPVTVAPGETYRLEAQCKTNWEVGLVQGFTGLYPKPGIALSIDDDFLPAGFSKDDATAAAHNAWEELETATVFSPPSGIVYIGCYIDAEPFPGTGPLVAWFDNLRLIQVDSGEVAGPCSGGPTIPGDGGFEPPLELPPPLPPPDTGLRSVSLWNLHAPYNSFAPIYGTVRLVQPNNLIDILDDVRAAGSIIILHPVGRNQPKVNGVFSQAEYIRELNLFVGIDISSYTDVVAGILVIDEPFCTSCWGTSSPIQWSVVDGVLGKRMSEIFPGFLLFAGVGSKRLRDVGAVPQYIRGAWNQYPGPFHGYVGAPNVEQFMAVNNDAAAALNLRQMWGINVANYTTSRRNITPDELRHDGMAMARDQQAYGVSLWSEYLPQSDSGADFLRTAPYVAALNDVVAAMTP